MLQKCVVFLNVSERASLDLRLAHVDVRGSFFAQDLEKRFRELRRGNELLKVLTQGLVKVDQRVGRTPPRRFEDVRPVLFHLHEF